MRRWSCCRRAFLQPFQLASQQSLAPPTVSGVSVGRARSSATDGQAQARRPNERVPPPQEQVMRLPQQHHFPFGIFFGEAGKKQELLIDPGPLLPLTFPEHLSRSLRRQIQRQHSMKLRDARQSQQLLMRQKQWPQRGLIQTKEPPLETSEAILAAEANDPLALQQHVLPSVQHSTMESNSLLHQAASAPALSDFPLEKARARKKERQRSRLLHATANSLAAAANMRLLTLRIARPFVTQLPLLCADTPGVKPTTVAVEKDLSACSASAVATLQTLGLRLGGAFSCTYSTRRRAARPPTSDLAVVREEVLLSLEAALR